MLEDNVLVSVVISPWEISLWKELLCPSGTWLTGVASLHSGSWCLVKKLRRSLVGAAGSICCSAAGYEDSVTKMAGLCSNGSPHEPFGPAGLSRA